MNNQPEKFKKYNSSTGCYKIDIYIGGAYVCSTDQSKTCKEAKDKFLEKHPTTTESFVKCFFFYY